MKDEKKKWACDNCQKVVPESDLYFIKEYRLGAKIDRVCKDCISYVKKPKGENETKDKPKHKIGDEIILKGRISCGQDFGFGVKNFEGHGKKFVVEDVLTHEAPNWRYKLTADGYGDLKGFYGGGSIYVYEKNLKYGEDMTEIKFKEVKTIGFVEKKVNFDELYELFKEKVLGFNLTPYGLLMQLSEGILRAPTKEMRFHFVEEGKEAIMATIRCVEIAEKLKEAGKKITHGCKNHGK